MARHEPFPHNGPGTTDETRRTEDMNLIRRFLSGYTENFLLALTLWPLASLLLTLPSHVARVYHRDGRLRAGTVVSTYLAVLYVLGLGCFTLWPLPSGERGLGITYGVAWQLDPLAFVGDFRREGISTIPQIAFNVVLFMPLGFIAGRLLRWGFWRSVVVGLLASLCIEVAQGTGLFGSTRTPTARPTSTTSSITPPAQRSVGSARRRSPGSCRRARSPRRARSRMSPASSAAASRSGWTRSS